MNENIVVVAYRTIERKKNRNVQLIFDNSYKVCSKRAPAIFMHSSCFNLFENCNATYIVLTKEKKGFAEMLKNRLKCLILQRCQRLKMKTKVDTNLNFEKNIFILKKSKKIDKIGVMVS